MDVLGNGLPKGAMAGMIAIGPMKSRPGLAGTESSSCEKGHRHLEVSENRRFRKKSVRTPGPTLLQSQVDLFISRSALRMSRVLTVLY
uniref:Uncharacterized protein n=1 Tax=Candidatus Kentrum sp. LFY TaxID=2126342 RepID=A0A450WIY6_9GAMM|nr:MAG: hypothetical protein BECKLFY1418C_GA0070996_10284 [Candidatus Kentron sp. LFY]